MPDTRHGAPAPVDGPGTTLLALTTLAMLVPLTEGRSLRWPACTIAARLLAKLVATVFWAVERRIEGKGRTPLVPPSLVRHPSMRRGLLLALPFFAGFGAFMFCHALLVQDGLHASALTAGLGLAPMAVAFLLASLSTSRLLARYGPKVLTAGGLLRALGLIVLAVTVCSLALASATGAGKRLGPPLASIRARVLPPSTAAGHRVPACGAQTRRACLGTAAPHLESGPPAASRRRGK
jgi:hypothetical protein